MGSSSFRFLVVGIVASNSTSLMPRSRKSSAATNWPVEAGGYAILNRARGHFPDLQSVMMDRATFLSGEDLWVEESAPSVESELPLLNETEREVFEGLRNGVWGTNLRLEQERIAWLDALKIIGDLHVLQYC